MTSKWDIPKYCQGIVLFIGSCDEEILGLVICGVTLWWNLETAEIGVTNLRMCG